MQSEHDGSEFVMHVACPSCGSSDANSLYDDGHTYCFSCSAYGKSDEEAPVTSSKKAGGLLDGSFSALPKRRINEATARKFGYMVGQDEKGTPVQIANYRTEDGVTGQKLRYPDKDMSVRGKVQSLFGQHLWSKGKMLVITEGEIDAMSVAQAQGLKWPAVSIPNGAQGAKKAIQRAMPWLDGFEQIILMFDEDDDGRKATAECAPLFEPGRCKIAHLPEKDANELLKQGREAEIVDAIWQAKPFRPDGIVRISDIHDALFAPVEWGEPWPWDTLTTLTYGRRTGEVYMLGAGTGVGKTDVFTQTIAFDLSQGRKVAAFYLEQPAVETVRRVAGKVHGQRFHVPDAGWSAEEWRSAVATLEEQDNLFLYDHFGSTDWDVVRSTIRYLAHSEGIKHFFIDHLTAFAAHAEDERVELEGLMADVASLAQELDIALYVISHLATPHGTPHEEGGRVMVRHFKGSRAIGYWSHYMFGLERDQQDDDEIARRTTTFRILKDRFTGQATGSTFYLRYDHDTGRLEEVESPSDMGDDTPF